MHSSCGQNAKPAATPPYSSRYRGRRDLLVEGARAPANSPFTMWYRRLVEVLTSNQVSRFAHNRRAQMLCSALLQLAS